jgi:hypothetical protein
MATGGVFWLITNDGKQDRMLMATELLTSRMDAIKNVRADGTPTLLDIEKTHILYTNAHFKPFVALGFEYNKASAGSGQVQLGSEVQFSIPQFGDFFADMMLYVKIDAPTCSTGTGADASAFYWCSYPGERLLKLVKFEVNGNPLDQYENTVTPMHRQFLVQPNKMDAWKRCMGQEIAKDAYLPQDASIAPEGYNIRHKVTDGWQTPKATLDSLTLHIPLLFWFCKDFRLAIPSVAIPHGMRYINITLASKDEMCGYITRGAGSVTTIENPVISQIALYINNIFVNPDIHKIFMRRVGFTLIRVHRTQTQAVSLAEQEILLQQMKWPIETLFVGFKPTTQANMLRDWDKFTKITESAKTIANMSDVNSVIVNLPVPTAYTDAMTLSATVNSTTSSIQLINSEKLVDRFTVSAHAVYLYNDLPEGFFNAYTTYVYGGHNIKAPEDEGLYMIPFCLYPGTYQPSGHINASRAREFYFRYHSNVIGSTVPTATMVVLASAINFLLISDGNAVLRYTT